MQYLPALARAGIEVDVAPLFDDAYLRALYAGKRDKRGLARFTLARLAQCRTALQADVIWLEKEVLPYCPWGMERLILPRGVPVVSDFDDAVFHRYDQHRNPLVRRLLGQKIDAVMGYSTLVTAGNAYLAQRARAAGARWVEIVPTVVDAEAYQPEPTRHADDGRPRIGWIGTPQTWGAYGAPLVDFFQDVARRWNACFHLVGARLEGGTEGAFNYVPWSEAGEIPAIQAMDIGIMPLKDEPWERGKCGYKLIQYMACSLPVVASPVGVNRQIVEHGVNGFLAETPDEWRIAVDALLADPGLRYRMGQAGRQKVEREYCIQVTGPRLVELLRSAAAGRDA